MTFQGLSVLFVSYLHVQDAQFVEVCAISRVSYSLMVSDAGQGQFSQVWVKASSIHLLLPNRVRLRKKSQNKFSKKFKKYKTNSLYMALPNCTLRNI